jgi:hypothetical protein
MFILGEKSPEKTVDITRPRKNNELSALIIKLCTACKIYNDHHTYGTWMTSRREKNTLKKD